MILTQQLFWIGNYTCVKKLSKVWYILKLDVLIETLLFASHVRLNRKRHTNCKKKVQKGKKLITYQNPKREKKYRIK